MREHFVFAVKGLAMGAANVIPGVSGGTLALITGIFERLIQAIKSFNINAFRVLLSGDIRKFARQTDLFFLLSVFVGIVLAIISLARIFDYLFNHYPVYIWAYFFGLVAASVYFVGKTVSKWSVNVFVVFLLGIAAAVSISFFNPARENTGFFYLVLCGVVAICSMILPGLSGSFVLILMGNYKLIAIDAINNRDIAVLFPVIVGAVVGLVAFSHLLAWIFKRYRNQTISLLTGFILGSLSVLWPWQKMEYLRGAGGALIEKGGRPIVIGSTRYIPDVLNMEMLFAVALIAAGVISIWLVERVGKGVSEKKQ